MAHSAPTIPAASRGATYSDLIVEAFERFADNEAFVLGEQRMTFAEAADSMSRIQQLLVDRGISHGSGVGALSVNIPEVWLTQAATYLIGGHYTGLHPMGSVEDHVWICDDAEIEVLIVHPTFAEVGAAVAERSKTVKHLLVFGESDAGQDLFELIEGYDPKPLEPGPAGQEDLAWLQYTGGTTGTPKGVMLSHRAMAEQCKAVLTSWQLPAKPRYLVAPPITHAGVLPLFPTLARGGTVILLQGFEPKSFVQAIEKEQANCTFAVPTMINALLDHTTSEDADLSSLETFVYGAAPISPSRLTQALNRFGQKFVQCYGQTECVGVTTSLLREEHDPVGRPDLLSSCGRPVIGTTVTIVDEADQPVPDGIPGELCVRSPVIMSGYWNRPDLTEETLRNGWLHTGDMAMRDEQGYLHIVDRKKDMVISGGFNVYPKEVEDVIAAHPDVAAVAVVGMPDDKWGEAVTAFVVPHEGAAIDKAVLKRLVRDAKGAHQAPKEIHLVDALPATLVGKIDKKRLRAMGAEIGAEGGDR
ncbi:AMP-binding protein [Nocardioides lacusdianchii]|uniref:AMP-binding protein n=1 Tax=Nocardioides lacusdianchii TaxID=2783664 RepID=UPI001CD0093F|nr:AMP-binding protein [Nocardioides lacusdianchii]